MFRIAPKPGNLTEPYSQHVWTYACINSIARNIAGVNYMVKQGKTAVRPSTNKPLNALFERPNPHMTEYDLFLATMIYMESEGECLWVLDREDENEIPKGIFPVSGKTWKLVLQRDNDLFSPVKAWVYEGGRQEPVPFKPYQIVQFKYFSPEFPLRGLAPLKAADMALKTDSYAAHYNLEFFRQGGDPGGVLTADGKLNEDQYTRIKKSWDSRHKGASNAHRIAVLEGGLKYQQVGVKQRDMQFLDQRKWNRDEILAAFGVPKSEVSVYEDVNFATARSQDKGYWHKSLIPKMRHLESTIHHQLLAPLGGNYTGAFDLSVVEALQEELTTKFKLGRAMMEQGYTQSQINERLDLGMDAMDTEISDVSFVPSNLIPAEIAMIVPEPNQPNDEGTDPTTPDTPPNPSKQVDELTTLLKKTLFKTRKQMLNRVASAHDVEDAEQEVFDTLKELDLFAACEQFYQDAYDKDEVVQDMRRILSINGIIKQRFESEFASSDLDSTTEVANKVRGVLNFVQSRFREIAETEINYIREAHDG